MQLTIKLAPKQIVKAMWFVSRRITRSQLLVFGAGFIVMFLLFFGTGVLQLAIENAGGTPPPYINTLYHIAGLITILVTILMAIRQTGLQVIKETNDTTFGSTKYHLQDAGLYMEGPGWNAFFYWSLFTKIDHGKGFVLLGIDLGHYFVFPEEQIGDVEAFKQFVAKRIAASRSSA